MSDDNFYFQDKWFKTYEEMSQYVSKWKDCPLDQETAERLFDNLKKEIIVNIFLFQRSFTNDEFRQFLHDMFEFSINRLLHRKKNAEK